MLNRVLLVGRLTRDCELRYSQSGKAVGNFTLAVNRSYDKEQADFPNVVCFGKLAENTANYTRKGSLVGVDGRIQTRSYEKDGRTVYVTEVVADSVQFLEPKGKGSGEQKESVREPSRTSDDQFPGEGATIDFDDTELPF
jgi:single-strand DNA-binding protein